MRRSVGFGVLGVGVAFAVWLYLPSSLMQPWSVGPGHSERSFAVGSLDVRMGSRLELFSPGQALSAAASASHPPRSAPLEHYASAGASVAAKRTQLVGAVGREVMTPWRTSVIVGDLPHDRSPKSLAAEIQSELKRLGCYAGDVDGLWGNGSKSALSAFMQRVNASLPIDRPDLVLLTLTRSQPNGVCSAQCPRGQEFDGAGRCIPSAIIAQSTRKSAPPAVQQPGRVVAAASPDLPREFAAARMGVGAPDTAIYEISGTSVATSATLSGAGATTTSPPPAAAQQLPPKRAAKATPRRRYESSYRMVRHLFLNPLGPM